MVTRWVLGARPGGSYGFRYSKPGYSAATTPADPTQLVFDSDWAATLPIFYQTGVFSLATGTTQTFTYPTALSYTPFCSWLIGWSLAGPFWAIAGYLISYNNASAAAKRMHAEASATSFIFFNGTGGTVYLSGVVYRRAVP